LGEEQSNDDLLKNDTTRKWSLIEILPDPGFYLAGGFAGVISRMCILIAPHETTRLLCYLGTATAPLDRLKVYLIANVDKAAPVTAVKNGDAAGVVKEAGRPLILACKELWRAGGIRSLFAGM